jgi:hypothetical protein
MGTARHQIRRYLSGVQHRPDQSASWHDRHPPVRTCSPGAGSRPRRWLPTWLPATPPYSLCPRAGATLWYFAPWAANALTAWARSSSSRISASALRAADWADLSVGSHWLEVTLVHASRPMRHRRLTTGLDLDHRRDGSGPDNDDDLVRSRRQWVHQRDPTVPIGITFRARR